MTVQAAAPVNAIEPHGAVAAAHQRRGETGAIDSPATPQVQVGPHVRKRAKAARVLRPGFGAPSRPVGVLPGSDVLPVVHTIVQRSVSHPEAPLSLALIVGLFLLVQHRIDRRDPKLAGAPRVEPADLEFGGAIRLA